MELPATILVTGDRHYTNLPFIKTKLHEVWLTYFYEEPVVLVHGAAKGADTLAGIAGESFGWDVRAYPAMWDFHGKSAGVLRNQKMLDLHNVDLCVAFHNNIRDSKGTLDMIDRCLKKGIMVIGFGMEI